MKEFLQALKDQRAQHTELLRQLEIGKFGFFERGDHSVKALKSENVGRLRGIIAELDRGIDQIEQIAAKLHNAGQL